MGLGLLVFIDCLRDSLNDKPRKRNFLLILAIAALRLRK